MEDYIVPYQDMADLGYTEDLLKQAGFTDNGVNAWVLPAPWTDDDDSGVPDALEALLDPTNITVSQETTGG